jgi:serine/threonine protein kinase
MGPLPYSPRHSDIWSLGILLLNLLSSRNPWREASMEDATFAAYVRSHPSTQSVSPTPFHPILPLLLPISERISNILHLILHPLPSERLTLAEIKTSCEELSTNMDDWYDPKAIFDWKDGCARCTWEVEATDIQEQCEESLKSAWSTGSDSIAGSRKGSIILQRSIHSIVDSTPSSLFENTYSASLTGASTHIRETSSSSSDTTSTSPDFCSIPTSTPKNQSVIHSRSWKVFEDELQSPILPPFSSSSSSPLSPVHRSSSMNSLSMSFLRNNIDISIDHRLRQRPEQIFTSASSAVYVDSNGIPKTPKDILASLGLNVDVRDHDENVELEGSGVRSGHVEYRDDTPVIEWVEHERDEPRKPRRKGKGRRSFFGGITFGRMLFGGGERS